jgi:hypothetical protein
MNSLRSLTPARARRLARLPLAGIGREWPHAYQHLANGPAEVSAPRALHPAFHGCYDWHSAVHGHWTLVRLLRTFPRLREAGAMRAALDRNLTPAGLRTEADYFRAPGRGTFERPYGWGWLLALAAELRTWRDRDGRRWARAVRPLERVVVDNFLQWLPRQDYPVRNGVHGNTAFGLTLALDYARAAGHRRLAALIVRRSRDYFLGDRDAPAAWEPGGEDFLSPALTEAELMRRVLPRGEFAAWLHGFLPGLVRGEPRSLLVPPVVRDRRDAKQVHLDGLALSRAWALEGVAGSLPPRDRARPVLLESARRHAAAGLAHVASGNYVGEHWLATFAVYLLIPG